MTHTVPTVTVDTDRVAAYEQLCQRLDTLPVGDYQAMSDAYTATVNDAFTAIADHAANVAYAGRVDDDNRVLGAHEIFADLGRFAVVPGAVDLAIAVLAADRISYGDFQTLTGWATGIVTTADLWPARPGATARGELLARAADTLPRITTAPPPAAAPKPAPAAGPARPAPPSTPRPDPAAVEATVLLVTRAERARGVAQRIRWVAIVSSVAGLVGLGQLLAWGHPRIAEVLFVAWLATVLAAVGAHQRARYLRTRIMRMLHP